MISPFAPQYRLGTSVLSGSTNLAVSFTRTESPGFISLAPPTLLRPRPPGWLQSQLDMRQRSPVCVSYRSPLYNFEIDRNFFGLAAGRSYPQFGPGQLIATFKNLKGFVRSSVPGRIAAPYRKRNHKPLKRVRPAVYQINVGGFFASVERSIYGLHSFL